MHRRHFVSMLGLGLLGAGATMSALAQPVGEDPTIAPPAPRVEVIPARPGPRYFWINGHWRWDGRAHVWVPGHWEPNRDGLVWVPAHWARRGGFWHFLPGHWRRV
jgi:WXXGXW repeat (2 copies)